MSVVTRRPHLRHSRPAAVVRRILDGLLRRRLVVTSSGELGTLRGADYPEGLAPDVERAPERLRAEIRRLADGEVLDEGNAGVLEPVVDSWVVQWQGRIDEHHRTNQTRLQDYQDEAAQDVTYVQAELQRVEDEINAIRRYLVDLAAEHPDDVRLGESPRPPRPSRRIWPFPRRRTP